MGFGVKVEDLTDDHEEARVDELFVWIERYEQKGIKHTPVNQKAYELLKNDKDLFPRLSAPRGTSRQRSIQLGNSAAEGPTILQSAS